MLEPAHNAGQEARDLTREEWLHLVKGFNRLTLGIPLTLLLFVGIVQVRMPGDPSPVPSYILGVGLSLWGCYRLGQVRNLTPLWEKRVRWTTLVGCLHLYFAPFVTWWTRVPHEGFLTFNILLLMGCMTWMLLLANQLCAEVAKLLKDPTFVHECQVWGWGVVLLMLLPMLLFFSHAAHLSFQYETDLFLEMTQLLQEDIPVWTQAAFLLPFTLTVVTLWKTHERCMDPTKLTTKNTKKGFSEQVR